MLFACPAPKWLRLYFTEQEKQPQILGCLAEPLLSGAYAAAVSVEAQHPVA